MRSAIFLSIREKATRLPKKVLLEIKGKTVTEHLIDRLKATNHPDLIVLCTSTHPDDSVLIDIAEKTGIKHFRGSEDDKLIRYFECAIHFNIDFIIIVDGDDLFCDPIYIDKIIEKYYETNADYITVKGLPLGAAAHGIKLKALQKVCELKDDDNTEVWGGYFTETKLFDVKYIEADKDVRYPEYRMTLDYKEDFDFFKVVFNELYGINRVFSLREIIELLNKRPDIISLNTSVQELYIENLQKQIHIKLKKELL